MPSVTSAKTLAFAAAAVLAITAGVGVWLALRVEDSPAGGEPGRRIPRPAETRRSGRLGETIRLELPRESTIARLRTKTTPGTDRFAVEAVGAEAQPHLARLREWLRRPAAAPDGVLDPSVSGTFLPHEPMDTLAAPRGTRIHHASARGFRPGTGPAPGSSAAAEPSSGVAAFRSALLRLVQPLESAAHVALKVVGVEKRSDEVVMNVFFELAGRIQRGDARPQLGWFGQARLRWRPESWKLLKWRTLEVWRVELDGATFADLTRRALGKNKSYDSLLARGLDFFRRRIDAATGMDVYGHHGAAVGDANGDDRDDVYLAMPPGLPNVLLLGGDDGTFTDASEASGANVLDGTSHALFVDADNDGDDDLILVTSGGLILLENGGNARFTPRPGAFPVEAQERSTPIAVAAADYDLDGNVDLYVASYVFWRSTSPEVGSRMPIPYHNARNGAPNSLFRNLGGCRFANVTAETGLNAGNNRFSFAASWADYDNDGDPDLYVANDFGSNNLYRNNGDGSFTEATGEAGVSDVGPGMSVSWSDVDNDGWLDLYVGNMFSAAGRRVTSEASYKASSPALQATIRRHARGNSLFRNREGGGFEDVSTKGSAYFGRWSWAAGFIDFNLDGRDDIYVQNGFITNTRKHDL